ncbi:uncharacterized protein PV09_08311 [Verruconis gallopava]|uniref:Uncharacterized protein n=1 Tax=Verruconis gallopava TaxID=253628 RepID=A0A0D2A0G9_9PEZI|nr:uncharacterized protein PV09_08311 [Verruconis gallopava]KIW00133.1 hypothetical protein PV09_08311 [Verruconis gallopava]
MSGSPSKSLKGGAKTIGSSHFDPVRFLESWNASTRAPQNNDLRAAIMNAFGLKPTDDYVYHAIASVTLAQVQVAIDHGSANGMHAWYRDEAGQQIAPPSQADIEAYTQIFSPTTATSKALAAFAGNAKKGSLRASISKHLVDNFFPPSKESGLVLPAKQKAVPIPNPAFDFWTWSSHCLEWAGPNAHTVNVKQSHHILPVFYHHFGCVCPTWDALSLISQLAKPPKAVGASTVERPVLDLGSGNGYWTFLLRRVGLTVYAVDNALSAWRTMWIGDTISADAVSFLKTPQKYVKTTSAAQAIPTASAIGTRGQGAVLLLVYPQVSNDFTPSVLQTFNGDAVVVAGTQNLNGFTGPPGETVTSWMARERPEFERVAQIPLPSFAGKDEALFIFVRRKDI